MSKTDTNILLTIIIVICLIIAGFTGLYIKEYLEMETDDTKKQPVYDPDLTIITQSYVFSEPVIRDIDEVSVVSVQETNLNSLGDGIPVIPVNVSSYELTFGSNIINVTYEYTTPKTKQLNHILSYGSYNVETDTLKEIYNFNHLYPGQWMSYHTGGGLSDGIRKTFLVLRANPIRYSPGDNSIQYITHMNVTLIIDEPDEPIIDEKDEYDLLIITPSLFENQVEPLVEHKNQHGIDTTLVTTEEIYEDISEGEDDSESIKYYIKQAIEQWGIRYVLLIGGLKRQTSQWNLPIRYSYVIPPIEQEYAEPKFITDLYFSDIYDAHGNFSSWNTNDNDMFSEWHDNKRDDMDLYPDVYVGRLPCRNKVEVRNMVNKIISYEEKTNPTDTWFNRIVLIGGDSYPDENQYNEGESICNRAAELLPGFDPVKVYASEKLTSYTINRAINNGAGFLYFCGHGGVDSWGTHNPPNAEGWAPKLWYKPIHMKFLRNKNQYPVAVIGGCLNGKFDLSIMNSIRQGKYSTIYQTQCWAWALTSERNGGAIATIANSGLGTHGRDDNDHNGIIDYNEVLDGWMELRFLELYGMENQHMLGDNMGQTLTEYLHRFHGNNDKMDTKMVQQWILFGDPSLSIGGI